MSTILRLDLGCGKNKPPGYIGMDRVRLEGVDLLHDLRDTPWPTTSDGGPILQSPIPESTVDEVRASHVLEHTGESFLGVMEEIHRILKPGGRLVAVVPYYRSEGAFRDPTHNRFFTEHTFDYFSPDGDNDFSGLNYLSRARFRRVHQEFGWTSPLSWHLRRFVPRLFPILERMAVLLGRKDELRYAGIAVKEGMPPEKGYRPWDGP